VARATEALRQAMLVSRPAPPPSPGQGLFPATGENSSTIHCGSVEGPRSDDLHPTWGGVATSSPISDPRSLDMEGRDYEILTPEGQHRLRLGKRRISAMFPGGMRRCLDADAERGKKLLV